MSTETCEQCGRECVTSPQSANFRDLHPVGKVLTAILFVLVVAVAVLAGKSLFHLFLWAWARA